MFAKVRAAIFLMFILCCESSSNLALAANGFVYTPPGDGKPGKLSGEFPLERMGKILLPRGLATFSEDELTIKAVPQWLFDRNVVLKGPVVRAEAVSQQNDYVLGGLVYFMDGMWSDGIANTRVDEVVDTMDGARLKGRIIGRKADAFSLRLNDGSTTEIAFSRVKSIESPRAFTFNIQSGGARINATDGAITFDTKNIVMMASNPQRSASAARRPSLPKSTLSGTEEGISKTALATFVALDIMNMVMPPIAIPLVLNAKNQAAAKRTVSQVLNQGVIQSMQPAQNTQTAAGDASGL